MCSVNIIEGEKALYGVSFEKDTACNVRIIEDNEGLPIYSATADKNSQQIINEAEKALKERAGRFVADCFKKYEKKCGNNGVDEGEECDGNLFKEFGDGKGKCPGYDSERFIFGDLVCNPQCKISTSSCKTKTCIICSSKGQDSCEDDCIWSGPLGGVCPNNPLGEREDPPSCMNTKSECLLEVCAELFGAPKINIKATMKHTANYVKLDGRESDIFPSSDDGGLTIYYEILDYEPWTEIPNKIIFRAEVRGRVADVTGPSYADGFSPIQKIIYG